MHAIIVMVYILQEIVILFNVTFLHKLELRRSEQNKTKLYLHAFMASYLGHT